MKQIISIIHSLKNSIANRILGGLFDAYINGRIYTITTEVERVQDNRLGIKSMNLLQSLDSCGVNVIIKERVYISVPKSMQVGNNVYIGNNSQLLSEGGITIGDNTRIDDSVSIFTYTPNYHGASLPYDQLGILSPVAIGKNVHIGRNVSVYPGTTIGDGAIIHPGSIVTENVPALAIVASPPAQIIDYRKSQHYLPLEEQQRYMDMASNGFSYADTKQFAKTGRDIKDDIFFVVTTGRSGSVAIAQTLSQHPDITCLHEPRAQLIRLSSEYAYQEKDRQKVKEELENIYLHSTVYPNTINGESNHKLFNFISLLNEIFPHCKFIWLVRDGRKVVSSFTGRGVYGVEKSTNVTPIGTPQQVFDYYRLNGYKCGLINREIWESMSAFERNCWYWNHVNREIEKQLLDLPQDRWIQVKLEDLNSKVRQLLDFVGATPIDIQVLRENVAKYPVKEAKNWSDEEGRIFEKWCGELMNKLYPHQ